MIRRNTIQKEIVLQTVRKLNKHSTAEQIYEEIHKEHASIGKGTVYRDLNILAQENLIKKIEVANGSDRFDPTLIEHYHVRCIYCGSVEDVDLYEVPDLLNLIKDDHGIKYLGYDIMFKGICQNCQNENK